MATEQGYSNQKKKGSAQFKTIHNVGSDAFGTVSISKSLYDISVTNEVIASVTDIFGSDGQIKFWKLQIVSHGASVGNVLRITSGAIKNFEFEIVGIVDADNIHVLPISTIKPIASDTAKVMGWVTNKTDDTGAASFTASVTIPPEGVVVASNSTTTPLAANGVFTGAAMDLTGYAVIEVGLKSDVPSATDGLKVELSTDGVNWDHSHATTYTAASGIGVVFNAEFKYGRVVYINDGSPQSYFRLQTILKVQPVKQSLYTLDQTATGGMFAELGKNVIIGKTTGGGGGYVPVKVTPSGALTVEASVTSSVLPDGAAQETTLTLTKVAVEAGNNTLDGVLNGIGLTSFTPATTDTGDFSIIAFIKRGMQKLETIITSLSSTQSTLSSFSGKSSSALVTVPFDEIVTTYVGSTTDINTVVYKNAGVTVATLTMSYDGSNRLIGVVRS